MDGHNNGGSSDRYAERTSSSSSSAWANPNNGPPSSVKTFGGLQSVTNDVWVSLNIISGIRINSIDFMLQK